MKPFAWRPGEILLGEFEVLGELGRGGMASVHLVRHLDLRHYAAVKSPFPEMIDSAAGRRIFAREVETWISLPKHPHLVECYYLRDMDGCPLVFAEYVPSGSLASWIARNRIHGLPHVLDLGIQWAEAMRVAQQRGVVHRDLKPANCLLDDAGRLKVSDFGLATARIAPLLNIARPDSQGGKAWPFSAGTQAYCSPEQLDGRETDVRTDIWSFGVSLFELISRQRPGFGPAAPFAIRAHQLSEQGSQTPVAIWDFLLTLVEPDLQHRPDSFATVADGLRGLYRIATGCAYTREFPDAVTTSSAKVAPMARSGETQGPSDVRAVNPSHPAAPTPADRTSESVRVSQLAASQEAAQVWRNRVAAGGGTEAVAALGRNLLRIAQLQSEMGHLKDAAAAYGECIEQLLPACREASNLPVLLMLVTAMHDRATAFQKSGDLANALQEYERGLKLFARMRLPPGAHAVSNLVAHMFQNRAMAHFRQLRYQDALRDATQAIELREKLAHDVSGGSYEYQLAGSYCNRAVIHRNMGDDAGALADYVSTERICHEFSVGQEMSVFESLLGVVYMNRSVIRLAANEIEAAIKDSGNAIAIFIRQCQSNADLETCFNLSKSHNNRAVALRSRADNAAALLDLRRCREIREEIVLRRGHHGYASFLARACGNEALCHMDLGNVGEMLDAADRGVAILESIVRRAGRSDARADFAKLLAIRGRAHASLEHHVQAAADLDQAVSEYSQLLDCGGADVVSGLAELLPTWARATTLVATVPTIRSTVAGDSSTPGVDARRFCETLFVLTQRLCRVPMNGPMRQATKSRLQEVRQVITNLVKAQTAPELGNALLANLDQFPGSL